MPLALERRLGGHAEQDLPGLRERRRLVEQPREREGRVGIAGMERKRTAQARDARRAIAGGEPRPGRAARRTGREAAPAPGAPEAGGELARQLVDQAAEVLEGPRATSGAPWLGVRRRRAATASA